jgi:hypothetical protein
MGRSPTLPCHAAKDRVLTTYPAKILSKLKEITQIMGTCPLLRLGSLLTTRIHSGEFSTLYSSASNEKGNY